MDASKCVADAKKVEGKAKQNEAEFWRLKSRKRQ